MIDLDQIRAAKREQNGQAPEVKFGGKKFPMPAELPFEAVVQLSNMGPDVDAENVRDVNVAVLETVKILFGKRYREFMDLGPSAEEITGMFDGLLKEYGLTEESEKTKPKGK